MDVNDCNIYSEPVVYPTSQAGTSTQVTQTQFTQDVLTQRNKDKYKRSHSASRQSKKDGHEDDLNISSDGDSDSDDFQFSLDSLVMKASKISQDFCTTGCPNLDTLLNGGIPAFGITELYGEAGVGKTQLCLQLAITAQLPKSCGGLGAGGVYYICTEDALPTKRLVELTRHFQTEYPNDLPSNLMSNIFIEHVSDVAQLMQCVEIKLSSLARINPERKVRLVILDSVAAIFRSEFDNIKKRTTELRNLAQILHEYSHDYGSAILVCNQVTANPLLEGNIAALGLAWKNMLTTRIRMSKTGLKDERALYVSFSPHAPSVQVSFSITTSGFHAMPPPQQVTQGGR